MPDYEKTKNLFHLIAGTYISGKIFSEYSCLIKHEIDCTKKGQQTIVNRVLEAEVSATKAVNILGEQLKSIGCDLRITEDEVTNLENLIYEVCTLDEVQQKRVLGLIQKIKRNDIVAA